MVRIGGWPFLAKSRIPGGVKNRLHQGRFGNYQPILKPVPGSSLNLDFNVRGKAIMGRTKISTAGKASVIADPPQINAVVSQRVKQAARP